MAAKDAQDKTPEGEMLKGADKALTGESLMDRDQLVAGYREEMARRRERSQIGEVKSGTSAILGRPEIIGDDDETIVKGVGGISGDIPREQLLDKIRFGEVPSSDESINNIDRNRGTKTAAALDISAGRLNLDRPEKKDTPQETETERPGKPEKRPEQNVPEEIEIRRQAREKEEKIPSEVSARTADRVVETVVDAAMTWIKAGSIGEADHLAETYIKKLEDSDQKEKAAEIAKAMIEAYRKAGLDALVDKWQRKLDELQPPKDQGSKQTKKSVSNDDF